MQAATPRSGGVVLGYHLTQLGTGYSTGRAHTQALRSTGSGLQLDLTAVRDQGIVTLRSP